jgi:hypothetical protein
MGGWNTESGTLIQDGSEQDASCGVLGNSCVTKTKTESLWYEIWPDESEVKITTIKPKIGDHIETDVSYGGGAASFTVCDTTQAKCLTLSQTPSAAPGGSVEYVVERPYVGGELPYLANTGKVTLSGASYVANGTTHSTITAALPYDMYSCANPMAQMDATAALSGGNSFSVTWKSYGEQDIPEYDSHGDLIACAPFTA